MRGDDVRAPLEQEARHRGHDPGPVGAADQQPRGVALGVSGSGGRISLPGAIAGSSRVDDERDGG